MMASNHECTHFGDNLTSSMRSSSSQKTCRPCVRFNSAFQYVSVAPREIPSALNYITALSRHADNFCLYHVHSALEDTGGKVGAGGQKI